VGLHLISVHHAEHGLAAVERVSAAVPGLGPRVVGRSDAVHGAVVLATCNRLEVYVDADADVEEVAGAVSGAIAEGLAFGDPSVGPAPVGEPPVGAVPVSALTAGDALQHLFHVGAGLDSMVVGEREIAGQLRRALRAAQAEGTATGLLVETIEQALRTARKVSHLTRLAANGRSVVTVGLDLLSVDWPNAHVLLLGTGAYAGAVVADLRHRGCADVAVQSSSGRAESFAETHPGVRVAGGLPAELADADVVVTCRGTGGAVLGVDQVAAALPDRGERDLAIVDLAVTHDVDPAVGALDGVLLVDLAVIQRHVPGASQREVGRARQLVDAGVQDLVARLRGREMDPAVVALRDTVNDMVEDEVARLPRNRPVSSEEAAHALRRLAARLVHVPSVRARKAAEEGRTDEYLTALAELWGIEPELRPALHNLEMDTTPLQARDLDETVPPATLDDDVCPATGLSLGDLGARRIREAM